MFVDLIELFSKIFYIHCISKWQFVEGAGLHGENHWKLAGEITINDTYDNVNISTYDNVNVHSNDNVYTPANDNVNVPSVTGEHDLSYKIIFVSTGTSVLPGSALTDWAKGSICLAQPLTAH